MIYTTLNQIRDRGPCPEGWAKLLGNQRKTKADAKPLSFATILESNGLDDALWGLRCVDEPAFCRRLAVRFAREVQHLMRDPRSIAALDVAERHASGLASDEELAEARTGAADAAYAAYAYAAAADAAAADAAYAAADAHAANAAAAARAAYAAGKKPMRQRQTEIFLEALSL